MKYTLTAHARKRIAERAIPKGLVEDALQNPTKMFYDNKRQLLKIIKNVTARNIFSFGSLAAKKIEFSSRTRCQM